MSASASVLTTLGALAATFVAFAVQLALLIVALTVVRRHRVDASTLLAASASVGLLSTTLRLLASLVLPRALALSDFVHANTIVGLGL